MNNCSVSPPISLMSSSFKVLTQHLHKSHFSSFSLPCPHLPSTVSFLRCYSSLHSDSFMEVVKAVYKQGNAAADSIAIRADQKDYTYAQLISSACNISNLLCDAGIKTDGHARGNRDLGGARIGIVAKPSAEFVAGVLATWFSGGVAVPLALSYPETELLHVMNDSEISFVLSTEDYQELLQNVATKCAAQFSLIPSVSSISSHATADHHSQIGVLDIERGEDPALIVYTSGTTGRPKGVVHTHKSITAQVQTLAEAWEYRSTDQFLNCLPLHHVHGLFNALFAPIYAGSTVEFMTKFSVRGIWQRWRESFPANGSKSDNAITVFTGVPTMYTRLIQGYEAMDPELQQASASAARQLRLMMCGSSALPLPIMEQWEKITGHRLLERYGMTEFVMAISNPLEGPRKAGTVGKPFPGVQVKIVKDENEDDANGLGELCVKSPSLFKEYWKLPKVTNESFTDDGFFKTGDAGKIDEDGYYIILGRTSADIMKVGGFKLSALEIESVLLEHPVVAECCVLGLPDKDYGDSVSAIIVVEEALKKKRERDSKPSLTLEELCEWAKEKLAPYKLPTRLFLWDSLPRNAMGKVNKKELKKQLSAEQ
ncbi:probable CoA ligase CCL8 [Euphorbia lathyris]|uniref:probable CoA ligase CCL8 n=1 Tax=Euphorbia lathyris TaxID=212925 RepID=UPI003313FE62